MEDNLRLVERKHHLSILLPVGRCHRMVSVVQNLGSRAPRRSAAPPTVIVEQAACIAVQAVSQGLAYAGLTLHRVNQALHPRHKGRLHRVRVVECRLAC